MKQIIFALTVFSLFATSCAEQTHEQIMELKSVELGKLGEYNMKLIPEKPSVNDEIKLIVLDDCTYNVLSGVNQYAKNIVIEKKFNSMKKMPCVQKNDTILIGKLAEGAYTIDYKLIDESTIVTNPIVLSFSFNLPVLQ